MGIPFRHVFACESDKWCRKVVKSRFEPEIFYDDLWEMAEDDDFPICDILVAGLPCQAFSSIGQQGGLHDKRGQLFLPLCSLLRKVQPTYVIFENVASIMSKKNEFNFWLIMQAFYTHGYVFKCDQLLSSQYGVPQNRKRVYAVGYVKGDADGEAYEFPKPFPLMTSLDKILGGKCEREIGFTVRCGGRNSPIDDRHNWDGYIVDGKEMRIGPKHAAQLQGFPKGFYDGVDIPESEMMKQMGNTMTTTVVGAVMGNLLFDGVPLKKMRKKDAEVKTSA
jgi:DNA (cytosine-5)-methyltransferase 1